MYMETTIGGTDRLEINVMRLKDVEQIAIDDKGIGTTYETTWRKIIIGNLEINLFEE